MYLKQKGNTYNNIVNVKLVCRFFTILWYLYIFKHILSVDCLIGDIYLFNYAHFRLLLFLCIQLLPSDLQFQPSKLLKKQQMFVTVRMDVIYDVTWISFVSVYEAVMLPPHGFWVDFIDVLVIVHQKHKLFGWSCSCKQGTAVDCCIIIIIIFIGIKCGKAWTF